MKKIIVLLLLSFSFLLISCNRDEVDVVRISLRQGVDTVEIHTEHVDAGARARALNQNLDVIVVSNNVDITTLGTYQIVYQTTYDNKTYQMIRIVHVVDQTPPTLTLNEGVDTIFIGQSWVDAGVIVTDNSLEQLSYTVTGTVNAMVAGTYEIIYETTDSSGNTGRVTRYVHVISPE